MKSSDFQAGRKMENFECKHPIKQLQPTSWEAKKDIKVQSDSWMQVHPCSQKSYHGQGHDANQVLLADEDLWHCDVRGPPPWVFHLPGDGLAPWEAAEAGDFKVHLHNLIE